MIDLWLRFELLSGRREEPPYWSVVWPGAKLLAAVLLNNPAFVFGRRVVDVGCGAGVAGIAAAKAGAAVVVANDVDPFALEAARFNAGKNGVVLDTCGEDLTQLGAQAWKASDTVLLSEMFYDAKAAERMWLWLKHLRARGVKVLLADSERPFFCRNELETVVSTTLPVNYELEGVTERSVSVYTLNA